MTFVATDINVPIERDKHGAQIGPTTVDDLLCGRVALAPNVNKVVFSFRQVNGIVRVHKQ